MIHTEQPFKTPQDKCEIRICQQGPEVVRYKISPYKTVLYNRLLQSITEGCDINNHHPSAFLRMDVQDSENSPPGEKFADRDVEASCASVRPSRGRVLIIQEANTGRSTLHDTEDFSRLWPIPRSLRWLLILFSVCGVLLWCTAAGLIFSHDTNLENPGNLTSDFYL